MKFPIEKYHFYVGDAIVVAVSSYGGKIVRGVAKCDPRDEFDLEKGKQLAALRCNVKIAKKRSARANALYAHSIEREAIAKRYKDRMKSYMVDSEKALKESTKELNSYTKNI